jgi:dihydrolipoamide dehydrogenase
MYAEAKNSFKKHGVLVDGLAVDLAAMQKQKVGAVEGLTKGIEGLLKKNKVCLQQEVCILPCV